MLGRIGGIHRASMRLHRISDPEVLARDIIDILRDVMPLDFAAVYLVESEKLIPFAVSDRGLGEEVLQSDKSYLKSLDLKVGEHVTGWVAKHGKSLLIRDIAFDPRFLDSRPGVRSELCVPMKSGNEVTGVINLEATQVGAYTESERSVLEIIAAQLALAIDNAKLKRQIAELKTPSSA